MNDIVKIVRAELFADTHPAVFCVLDGAAVQGLRNKLFELKPEHICLWRGELAPDMAEVAPYLVRLNAGDQFTEFVLQGWGKSWGIFAFGPPDLRAMRQHFRTFLTVHDTEGRPLRFRYYDPRVMRVYLPTCLPDELGIIFGPVLGYLMEGETPDSILTLSFEGGALKQEEKKAASEEGRKENHHASGGKTR